MLHGVDVEIHSLRCGHFGIFVAEDLRSANGTFVNDRTIPRGCLRDGDPLRSVRDPFQVRLPEPGERPTRRRSWLKNSALRWSS